MRANTCVPTAVFEALRNSGVAYEKGPAWQLFDELGGNFTPIHQIPKMISLASLGRCAGIIAAGTADFGEYPGLENLCEALRKVRESILPYALAVFPYWPNPRFFGEPEERTYQAHCDFARITWAKANPILGLRQAPNSEVAIEQLFLQNPQWYTQEFDYGYNRATFERHAAVYLLMRT